MGVRKGRNKQKSGKYRARHLMNKSGGVPSHDHYYTRKHGCAIYIYIKDKHF